MLVHIYLVDPFGLVGPKLLVNTILQGYFNQVTAAGGNNHSVVVAWPGGVPVVTPVDVLVYYLDFGHSLAKAKASTENVKAFTLPFLDGNGTTILPPVTTMSEVYSNIADATTLANVTFHECMHNKLRQNNTMHSNDGLRKGEPQGGVGPQDTLSPTNAIDMARVIARANPQFVAGFGIIMSAIASKSAGDPIWDSSLL
jgi:hypothetical protein